MDYLHHACFVLTLLASFSLCSCFNPKLLNVSLTELSESDWSLAGATWYGDPDGAGSIGGACGYGDAVEKEPFSSMVSAGGPSLFLSGKGCGACYQVKCKENEACSGDPVTVVITDECPGGRCASDSVHFDLSGRAFGAMAKSGQSDQIRNVGVLTIQFKRVNCYYPGVNVAFLVDAGSNPYYLALVIKFVDGDGDLAAVHLQQDSDKNSWLPMQRSWGAVWKLDSGTELKGPFSIRLTAGQSHNTIEASKVIPADWKPGQIYRSLVSFKAA